MNYKKADNRILNVAATIKTSSANGPGSRYVIWVQGCNFRCKGCFNADFQDNIIQQLLNVEELAKSIVSANGIEGVTFSGGEPLLQARPLYYLSRILKQYNLSIICYTGYKREELNTLRDPYIAKLLGLVDVLIDGPYIDSAKCNLLWRGSSNQKVHFLTDRYIQYQSRVDEVASDVDILIGDDYLVFSGMLDEKLIKKILDRHPF